MGNYTPPRERIDRFGFKPTRSDQLMYYQYEYKGQVELLQWYSDLLTHYRRGRNSQISDTVDILCRQCVVLLIIGWLLSQPAG